MVNRKTIRTGSKIGVLALQGAFREHVHMLCSCGARAAEIRTVIDLEGISALIIPGGESTTIGKLALEYQLLQAIRQRVADGMPIWGTCAGMIFLAKEVGNEQPTLGLMDIAVERNAFGRQINSFEQDISVHQVNAQLGIREDKPFPAVFIRAPIIRTIGPGVHIIATLPDGKIVAAQQGKMLATAFHPELTRDSRFHRYFLDLESSA